MRRNYARLLLFRNTGLSIALHLHICKILKSGGKKMNGAKKTLQISLLYAII